tara:strand:- start:11610 stop:11909 length:300 start_codon:yes stop_codon:yes gene_type:complete
MIIDNSSIIDIYFLGSNPIESESDIFLPGIWAVGFFLLLLSWYSLRDQLIPSIFVFGISSVILFLSGPSAAAFALCLSSGWILLNSFIEKIFPISESLE